MTNIINTPLISRVISIARNSDVLELITVILFSAFTSFIILRNTILIPGFIAVRDTVPIFYNTVLGSGFSLNNSSYLVSFIDLSGYPVNFLLSYHIISIEESQKISYFLFPFFIGQISFYYSLRYFVRIYNFKVKDKSLHFTPLALSLSFIYVIEPIPAYFSFWSYMSTFISFAPLLIAASDLAFRDNGEKNKILNNSIILAVIMSLSMGDPRSFVYSILLVLSIYFIKIILPNTRRLKASFTLILSGFYFLCIDSRVFYVTYLGLSQNYLKISSNIAAQQNWALSYFFSTKQVIEGTPIYWGWVDYNYLSFLALIPLMISLIFVLNKKTNILFKYLFLILLILLLFLNNTFGLGILLSNFLEKYLYNYSYLFFTIYLVIIVPPLVYLLFSLGTIWLSGSLIATPPSNGSIKLKNRKFFKIFYLKSVKKYALFVLILFLILSQIVYSYPTLKSGDYSGLYKPVTPPQEMVSAGNFLLNSSGYNGIIAPSVIYPPPANVWNSNYSLIQMLSSYKNSVYINPHSANDSQFLSHLNYFGIQNIVVVNIFHNYKYLLMKAMNASSLKLELHQGYIYIFKVKTYKSVVSSHGLYLDYNEPFSNTILDQWNASIVNLPYYGQNIPIKYIKGLIGVNTSLKDILAILSSNYSLNLYSLVNRYSSNPSSPGPRWGYDISYYPFGATGISNDGEFSKMISFQFPKGTYIPLINGISFTPECSGIFNFSKLTISSAVDSTTLNFTSTLGVNFSNWVIGSELTSNGTINIKNSGKVYITSIRLIPIAVYKILRREAMLYSENLSIISAEKNVNALKSLIPSFQSGRNTTLGLYPYLDYNFVNNSPKKVTMIIHPSGNTFGVNNEVLKTPNLTYTSYYLDSTYYYIILGSDYQFVEEGYVNPVYVGIINFSTVSIAVLGTFLIRKLVLYKS